MGALKQRVVPQRVVPGPGLLSGLNALNVSNAFSPKRCFCYGLMVMMSPWWMTWATLTCLTLFCLLRGIKEPKFWCRKAMRLACLCYLCLCWSHIFYHLRSLVTSFAWACSWVWQLWTWNVSKTCFGAAFGAFILFIRSHTCALILVRALSRCLRYRSPPSDMKKIRAYHGTRQENVESIKQFGFRPSPGGMLGPGVYISRDLNKAQRYGRNCHYGVILELEVEVGAVCTIDKQGHLKQKTWQSAFDTAWVPSNVSMVFSQLEEGCIAAPHNIQLVRVWPLKRLHRLLIHEIMQLLKDAWIFLFPCTDEQNVEKFHRMDLKIKKDWGWGHLGHVQVSKLGARSHMQSCSRKMSQASERSWEKV